MPPVTKPGQDFFSRRMWGPHLCLCLLAALLTGLLVSMFWAHLELPDRPLFGSLAADARPWGLARFAALAGPVAVFLPSLALVLMLLSLPREKAGDLPRRALRLDALSYLILPLFLVLPLCWRSLGNGFAALGLCYLGVATIKGGALLHLWWRGFAPAQGHEDPERPGWRSQLALFLALFTLLAALALWTDEALSTASDEVGYLIFAHSLASHATLDPSQTLAGHEHQIFYWARWSPELGFALEQVRGILFPLLLAPPYFLGGRLGVLIFFAGLTAFTGVQLLAWLRQVGLSRPAAAGAAGLALASAPVLLLSQQVFPDVPGMLLVVLGLRLLWLMPRRPWLAGLGLGLVAVLLTGIKSRLSPLSAGLLLAAGGEMLWARWGRRGLWLLAGGLVLAAALVLWLPAAWWPQAVRVHWDQAIYQMQRSFYTLQPVVIFARGLALDQNFGLLVTAPIWLLGLAALPAAFRYRTRASLHLLAPALVYLGAVCFTRWFQWYGGFAGPGRFLAVLLPPGALFLGLALEQLRAAWLRLAALGLACLTLLYTWLNLLAPQLRFSRPTGVNPLLGALQTGLNLELFQLLPSTFTHSPALLPWALAVLVLAGGLGALIWRGLAHPQAPPAPAPPRPGLANQALALVLALALGGGLALAAAKHWPPTFLEAEHMASQGASQYVEYAYPRFMRGMVLLQGQSLSGRLYMPGGDTLLRVIGRPDEPGEVLLKVDDREIRQAWPPHWTLEMDVPLGTMSRGYHRIQVAWASCPERKCAFLLDRLEVHPAPAAPAP